MTRTEGARHRARYHEIGRVLVRNGLDWLIAEGGLSELLGGGRRRRDHAKAPVSTQPVRVRQVLESLGPTFTKLGQMLSTRPDLLPPEIIAELSKLQDQAPRVPYPEIAAVIARELGGPPEEIFQAFSVEPRAAASIGQVHDAVLPDGTPVVVKIQRPGIEPTVEEDLAILGHLARLLAKNSPLGKQYDLEGYVAEFAFTLCNELDYVREGRNADRIRANFAGDPSLHVPAVYWEYTTKKVLTMEALEGIKVSDLNALDAAGIDRHELAERCAHIAVTQMLEHRFFHADPHPGNFLILPDGTVGLLDYGMVGQLEDRQGQTLVRLGLAVSHQDPARLLDELLGLGAAPGPIDRLALQRDLRRLLQQYSEQTLGEISAARILGDMADLSRRHHLQLPSDLTLLSRTLVMDEGMGAYLDPGFHLLEFARPYLQRFWESSHSPRAVARRVREGAVDVADIGMELPQRLRHLLVQLDRGEFTVTSRLEIPEEVSRNFQQASDRVAISVLTAGSVIGLSVLASTYLPSSSGGTGPFLLRTLLALGILGSIWLLGAFWRSRR